MKTNQNESSISDEERCLCGQEGCLGHERVPGNEPGCGKVYVPGFTSQEAMDACPNEIVYFDHPLKPHVLEAVKASLAGEEVLSLHGPA